SAAGTGSLVTGDLTDTGALGGAALNLAGGTLVIDPTASTASNGLATRYINLAATNNQATPVDFAGASQGTVVGPAFQTPATAAAAGLAGTFSYGTLNQGASQAFATGVQTTNFAARWTGMIAIATPGPTTFTSGSDDAVRLYIDGVLVINNDGGHGPNGPVSG